MYATCTQPQAENPEHRFRHSLCREVHALAKFEAQTGHRLRGSSPAQRWILDHESSYRELVRIEARSC